MSGTSNRPDWNAIEQQFREYIADYRSGNVKPDCRDTLFTAIYQAVEYLSIVRYRHYAGRGTRQTDLALDGIQNRFWKIDADDTALENPDPSALHTYRQVKKQRTFTTLVTQEYREEAPLGNFLSTVVGNALRDWFREQNRHNKLNLQLHDDLFKQLFEIGISEIPASSMHLAWGVGAQPQNAEERLEMQELKKGIATLCLRDRLLLDLYYFQDLSYAEISQQTGVCESTLRTRISRAIETMRQVLSAQ